MRKTRKNRLWWWILLLAVALAGFVGYLLASKMEGKPEQQIIAEKLSSVETKELSDQPQIAIKEKIVTPSSLLEESTSTKPPGDQASEADCQQLDRNVLDFFRYLDSKQYTRNRDPKMDTYTHFKRVLDRMAANPPIPAGEGADPKGIVQNIYFLYRTLDRQDIGLMRQIIRNEKETLEFNLDLFYRWVSSAGNCPHTKTVRPSLELLYRYAGFFINTTGGRAYLFRRPADIRLLISYYCILIVNMADKNGVNTYGIDIVPYIRQIQDEIRLYPHFHLQSEYINRLTEIEAYYEGKR
jgi:hypothetical protein